MSLSRRILLATRVCTASLYKCSLLHVSTPHSRALAKWAGLRRQTDAKPSLGTSNAHTWPPRGPPNASAVGRPPSPHQARAWLPPSPTRAEVRPRSPRARGSSSAAAPEKKKEPRICGGEGGRGGGGGGTTGQQSPTHEQGPEALRSGARWAPLTGKRGSAQH